MVAVQEQKPLSVVRSQATLRAEGLNLFFGEKQVLKDVHLAIPERKVTALIGPSGCGKSTLLRCFNRMHDLSPDARITGSLSKEGEDLLGKTTSVTDLRKAVGMVFQKPNPLPKSIYENLAYPLRIHRFPKDQHPALIEQALRDSYLWDEVKDSLQKPAVRLSGGQQQRLCIARTIVLRPEVILMDEPCSALDPISTGKIEELILKMKDRYTIVIVTHNMQQAQRVADYTAFMYLGELVEFGQTAQVFQQPRHELCRKYVSGHFG